MSAVTVEQLDKHYADVHAVKGLDFSVGEGELFGIIGPDGAGKTTLFRMLTTLLIPDGGRALVQGLDTVRDYRSIRRIIGYMPGRFSLYQDLTVQENLEFFATVFGTTVAGNYGLIRDIYEQLEPFRTRRAGKLSGGMKQKLALCCALIHEPEVLFLDEPTTGVDAVSRAEFWEMLQRLRQRGITIVVSTPYMDEATRCERIALLQAGRILTTDTPGNIRAAYGKPLFGVRADAFYPLMGALREADFVERVAPFGKYLHLTSKVDLSPDIIRNYLYRLGHTGIEVEPIEASVEDVFLDLM